MTQFFTAFQVLALTLAGFLLVFGIVVLALHWFEHRRYGALAVMFGAAFVAGAWICLPHVEAGAVTFISVLLVWALYVWAQRREL